MLHGWCHIKLLPSRCVLCTPCNHAPCHVISCKDTLIRSVRACLAATCHLHFWHNDRDLLRATAVTHAWGLRQHSSRPFAHSFIRSFVYSLTYLIFIYFYYYHYPATWAATCRLWGIYLYSWRVDAIIQGAFRG